MIAILGTLFFLLAFLLGMFTGKLIYKEQKTAKVFNKPHYSLCEGYSQFDAYTWDGVNVEMYLEVDHITACPYKMDNEFHLYKRMDLEWGGWICDDSGWGCIAGPESAWFGPNSCYIMNLQENGFQEILCFY